MKVVRDQSLAGKTAFIGIPQETEDGGWTTALLEVSQTEYDRIREIRKKGEAEREA